MQKTWYIYKMASVLGENIKYVLFTRAFLGCYTTSHMHGFGKPQAMKLLEKNKKQHMC